MIRFECVKEAVPKVIDKQHLQSSIEIAWRVFLSHGNLERFYCVTVPGSIFLDVSLETLKNGYEIDSLCGFEHKALIRKIYLCTACTGKA